MPLKIHSMFPCPRSTELLTNSNFASGTASKIDAANLCNSADPWFTALNVTSSKRTSVVKMATTFSASWEFQAAIQPSAMGVFFCAAAIWATRRTTNTIRDFAHSSPCQTTLSWSAALVPALRATVTWHYSAQPIKPGSSLLRRTKSQPKILAVPRRLVPSNGLVFPNLARKGLPTTHPEPHLSLLNAS